MAAPRTGEQRRLPLYSCMDCMCMEEFMCMDVHGVHVHGACFGEAEGRLLSRQGHVSKFGCRCRSTTTTQRVSSAAVPRVHVRLAHAATLASRAPCALAACASPGAWQGFEKTHASC
jgi:hypothetical protein